MTVIGPLLILVQVGLALSVVLVLRVLLEGQLVEFALREFDRQDVPESIQSPVEINVTIYKELRTAKKEQLQRIAQRKYGANVKVALSRDKSLWGGIVIQVPDNVIRFGLKDRLKESGFIK